MTETKMRSDRPTMKDVAELAGVSLNVVSRVCHPSGKGSVSSSARQKVLAAIDELGYIPDSRARSLRNQRTNTIGFYTGYGDVTIDEPFARSIFDGLQAACSEHDQDLLLFHSMAGHTISDIVSELTTATVDGLVYHPCAGDNELAEALAKTGKPIIRIAEPSLHMSSVVAEDYYGARRLAYHLYDRGHRRVLFRLDKTILTSALRRYAGFCDAAIELGMTVIKIDSVPGSPDLSDDESRAILDFRSNKITAIACWRDWSASQVVVFCNNNKIHIPEDLAVVGFDGLTPNFCPINTRLTTFVIDWYRIAAIAVEKLIELINNETLLNETVQPCSVYFGNTT